jgi:histidyl-tRNA synthetase
MSNLKPPRGTMDLLPDAYRNHKYIGDTASRITKLFGFQEISTPIFESADVFTRTLGDTSDVVTKEMYAFKDKKGRNLSLRPEGTAGVARAFITHMRAEPLPLKLFYQGPMFRYERAQKGRQRQFHQFGVELLGSAEPLADIEVISLAAHILEELDLSKKVTLHINTLGDTNSRQAYKDILVAYFKRHERELSKDSKMRLDRNPMRILDSKDESDRAIISDAPKLIDHMNTFSADFFSAIQLGLDTAGIKYEINPNLVRGLDYYCHTAFEFITETLGAQGAVLAGGRYDGLIEAMGGPPTPGIGWAAGIERLTLMVNNIPLDAISIPIIPIGLLAEGKVLEITSRLRRAGFSVDMGYSGNLKKCLKRADKAGAQAAVIIGDEELAKGVATIRNMETGVQMEVNLSSLEGALNRFK